MEVSERVGDFIEIMRKGPGDYALEADFQDIWGRLSDRATPNAAQVLICSCMTLIFPNFSSEALRSFDRQRAY
jgi:hypothetical protein